MEIGVVGAGYVGLVTGVCLAEMGNHVTIVDIDKNKVTALKQGRSPHYEPGLNEILAHNLAESRLSFSQLTSEAAVDKEAVFLAVGTPMGENGAADMRYMYQAVKDVGGALTRETLIITKSTVPVGTNKKIYDLLREKAAAKFHVVSNPEFLKEGAAIEDFMRPDRVVIGTRCAYAQKIMSRIYEPFVRSGRPVYFMDPESAEMVKYASNALLASRISFMNEVARICERVGADVQQVRQGVGSDSRLGWAFLYPGLGYGGSCFPKDVRALAHVAQQQNVPTPMCAAIDQINVQQRLALLPLVERELGKDLTGVKLAAWGLAFKPQTDDIREAPALYLIKALLSRGASLTVFDPIAQENARQELGDSVVYATSPYEALAEAAGLLICTEWNEFRSPDFALMNEKMSTALIFDGRNLYNSEVMLETPFTYYSIGRQPVKGQGDVAG